MQFAQYIQTMCHWTDLSTTTQQSPEITMSRCHVDNDSEFSTSIPGAHVNLDPLYPSDGGFGYTSNDGYFAMPTPLFPLYNRHMMAASDSHEHSNQLNTNDTAYGPGLLVIPPDHDTYPEELALSPVELDNNTSPLCTSISIPIIAQEYPPIINLEQEPGPLPEKRLKTPSITSQSPSLPVKAQLRKESI
ncbi:hypothetical protein NPX13_g10823 [Xylaria arbuscula]|uniref:Uncharacterized protein n=1 Tax=Xylaria arbuscula TaxID=114810 RepID=A0A9W8N405_9PEZI|nr:hypothetical protein NPX13_g10823 [Xylaria arbuscula]